MHNSALLKKSTCDINATLYIPNGVIEFGGTDHNSQIYF